MRKYLLSALFIGAIAIMFYLSVKKSQLEITRDDIHFPLVSGSNLDRQEMVFPTDFSGEYNLVFIAFLQQQQPTVNTWVPFVQQLEAENSAVAYYEFPTIEQFSSIRRTLLNEGMRAGIPDQKSRERTITLYIDLEQFFKATGIPNRSNMHTLLVNRKGDILWRTTGTYSEEKGEEIQTFLASVQ